MVDDDNDDDDGYTYGDIRYGDYGDSSDSDSDGGGTWSSGNSRGW